MRKLGLVISLIFGSWEHLIPWLFTCHVIWASVSSVTGYLALVSKYWGVLQSGSVRWSWCWSYFMEDCMFNWENGGCLTLNEDERTINSHRRIGKLGRMDAFNWDNGGMLKSQRGWRCYCTQTEGHCGGFQCLIGVLARLKLLRVLWKFYWVMRWRWSSSAVKHS